MHTFTSPNAPRPITSKVSKSDTDNLQVLIFSTTGLAGKQNTNQVNIQLYL